MSSWFLCLVGNWYCVTKYFKITMNYLLLLTTTTTTTYYCYPLLLLLSTWHVIQCFNPLVFHFGNLMAGLSRYFTLDSHTTVHLNIQQSCRCFYERCSPSCLSQCNYCLTTRNMLNLCDEIYWALTDCVSFSQQNWWILFEPVKQHWRAKLLCKYSHRVWNDPCLSQNCEFRIVSPSKVPRRTETKRTKTRITVNRKILYNPHPCTMHVSKTIAHGMLLKMETRKEVDFWNECSSACWFYTSWTPVSIW